MAARTGSEYLAGLRDERAVWVNGEAVRDVTRQPVFKGSLAGMAGYFDWQHAHSQTCLVENGDGCVSHVSHLIPHSRQDLAAPKTKEAREPRKGASLWRPICLLDHDARSPAYQFQ